MLGNTIEKGDIVAIPSSDKGYGMRIGIFTGYEYTQQGKPKMALFEIPYCLMKNRDGVGHLNDNMRPNSVELYCVKVNNSLTDKQKEDMEHYELNKAMSKHLD
jgi:hypothetical protein